MRRKSKDAQKRCRLLGEYIDAFPEGFGKSKSQMLSYFQRLDFGASTIEDLLTRDFVKMAMGLLSGLQARPVDQQRETLAHYTFKPRKLQTVNGYMATLAGGSEERLSGLGPISL